MGLNRKKNLKTLLFALVMAAVVVLLAVLSVRARLEPPIPQDIDHLDLIEGIEECMRCHGETGLIPLSEIHPINQKRCLGCHKYEGTAQ